MYSFIKIAIMALALFPVASIAENVVIGTIKTSDSTQPVYQVSIRENVDTVKGSVTGSFATKNFKVPVNLKGILKVEITSLGYDTLHYTLTPKDSIADIGTAMLRHTSVVLKDVDVVAKNATITRDGADYTISNIQGSFLGNTGDMMNMLRWTPGVIVNSLDESIYVVNAGSPQIYINNRKIRSKSELYMLQSSEVTKILIIRAPGAEYQSTAAAIIKIYTAKPLKDYLGASVYDNLRIYNRIGNTSGMDINFKSGIISGNFGFSYSRNNSRYQDWERLVMTNTPTDILSTWKAGTHTASSNGYSVFAGLNFQSSKKSVIGVQYSGYYRNSKLNSFSTQDYDYNGIISNKEISSKGKNNVKEHMVSMSYVWDRKKDSQLVLTADYANYPKSDNKLSEEKNLTTDYLYNVVIDNSSKYHAYTFTGDFTFSYLGKDEGSTGVDFGHVNTKNKTAINYLPANVDRNNTWLAFYYTFKRTWGNFTANLGLRYEYDRTHTRDYAEKVDIVQNYSNVLPNVQLKYKFSKNYRLTAMYKHVIDRPNFSQINPTIYYDDSLNYNTGNPNLKPTITDRYRLILNVHAVSFSMQYWRYRNEVVDVMESKEPNSNIIISRPINIDHSDAWMMNVDYSLSVKKFSMTLSGGVILPYLEYPYLDGTRKVNNLFGNVYGNFSYRFNKTLSGSFSAFCSSASDNGISHRGSTLGMNLGLQASFLKNKLRLSLYFNDILNKSVTPNWEEHYGNSYIWHKNKYDTRGVTIGIRYTINDLDTKFKNRGGESSIYNRGN